MLSCRRVVVSHIGIVDLFRIVQVPIGQPKGVNKQVKRNLYG